MYVAITRARKRLYLSHAQTRMLHGQTRYNIPSRFLDEIPEALMKWLTPRLLQAEGVRSPISHARRARPSRGSRRRATSAASASARTSCIRSSAPA